MVPRQQILAFYWCCTFSHQFCFLYDFKTSALMQRVNIGGDFSCVLCCVVTRHNSLNEYVSYFTFIAQITRSYQRKTLNVFRLPHLQNLNIVISLDTESNVHDAMPQWTFATNTWHFLFLDIIWWCDNVGLYLYMATQWGVTLNPPFSFFFFSFFAQGADVPLWNSLKVKGGGKKLEKAVFPSQLAWCQWKYDKILKKTVIVCLPQREDPASCHCFTL